MADFARPGNPGGKHCRSRLATAAFHSLTHSSTSRRPTLPHSHSTPQLQLPQMQSPNCRICVSTPTRPVTPPAHVGLPAPHTPSNSRYNCATTVSPHQVHHHPPATIGSRCSVAVCRLSMCRHILPHAALLPLSFATALRTIQPLFYGATATAVYTTQPCNWWLYVAHQVWT